MKKIYVIHSSGFNFEKELYAPLKNSEINRRFEIILPHESEEKNSKNTIKNSDIIIAEVSFQKIGVGIEIGWADSFNIPIIFIYKKGSRTSNSLKFVSKNIIEYEDEEDMIQKLINMLNFIDND